MIFISCLLRNCVSIVCFTVLAIHFDKWWIALFALLFMMTVENKKDDKKLKKSCDNCKNFDIFENACVHPKCGGTCHPLNGEDCEYFSEYDWD